MSGLRTIILVYIVRGLEAALLHHAISNILPNYGYGVIDRHVVLQNTPQRSQVATFQPLQYNLEEAVEFLQNLRIIKEMHIPTEIVNGLQAVCELLPKTLTALAYGLNRYLSKNIRLTSLRAEPGENLAERFREASRAMVELSLTVEESLDHLPDAVKSPDYTQHVSSITAVNFAYTTWVTTETDTAQRRFNASCHRHFLGEGVHWFYSQMVEQHGSNYLKPVVTIKSDIRVYMNFATSMVLHFVEASVLHTFCSVLESSTDSPKAASKQVKHDARIYQRYLQDMTERIKDDYGELARKVFYLAEGEIERVIDPGYARSEATTVQSLCEKAIKKLEDDFPDMRWFLLCMNRVDVVEFKLYPPVNKIESGAGIEVSLSRFWGEFSSTFAFLTSPDQYLDPKGDYTPEEQLHLWSKRTEECVNKTRTYAGTQQTCKEVVRTLHNCIQEKETKFSATGCFEMRRDDLNYYAVKTSEIAGATPMNVVFRVNEHYLIVIAK